jgi:hypothetical protein
MVIQISTCQFYNFFVEYKMVDNLLRRNLKRLLLLLLVIFFYVVIGFVIRCCNAAHIHPKSIQCAYQLKDITYFCATYCIDHSYLPAYTVDENGKPLHSWRVLLLPYIGEAELYKKIRLDEPWDSEYNSQFHNHIMPQYQCRSSADYGRKPTTNYFFITGIGSVFDKTGKYVIDNLHNDANKPNVSPFKNVGRFVYDNSNVPPVLIVEGLKEVNWMCPVDISFEEYKSGKFAPSSKHHYNVVYSDFSIGRIRFDPIYYTTTEIIQFYILLILLIIALIQFCYLLILICHYLRSIINSRKIHRISNKH